MPRTYVKKADRAKLAAIVPDDESIVIRYFMESPIANALTAHRFAGYVLRQRQLSQTLADPSAPPATVIGERIEAATTPKRRRRRKVGDQLPPEQPGLPPYEDDPASTGGQG